jgi:hypothetical protein
VHGPNRFRWVFAGNANSAGAASTSSGHVETGAPKRPQLILFTYSTGVQLIDAHHIRDL